MQIFNATAAAADTAQTSATTTLPTPSASKPTDKLANESTFLQLLVAQIKNQDPLKPTDSLQFVGQLVQFSQLEQLIGIKSELDSLGVKTPTTPTPASAANVMAAVTKSISQ